MRPLDGALAALAAEAATKSSVLWLTLPSLSSPRAVWHVWHADAIWLVGGGGEQPLPGLEREQTVAVTLRSKENSQRLLVAPATVEVVAPDDPRYAAATAALGAARLNAAGGDPHLAWPNGSTVFRLALTGPVTERPGAYRSESHAAAPPASAAGTAGLRPFTVHRRARRRPPLT
jgi:hypothetical protein